MDTPGDLKAIFYKEDNFCEFLFTFLLTSFIFPYRVNPFSEVRQKQFWLVVSPQSVSVLHFLSPAFSKKSGGTLFLVFRGAWRVVRSAWCVVPSF